MSTYFLNSDAVEVFPSGYRDDNYPKARSMIEENFTNLTKFTDDQYRNFAYQLDSDKIVVNLSGYRFCISANALYELLTDSTQLIAGTTEWNCYLYIKLINIQNNQGKVLQNLFKNSASQVEQLDDIIGDNSSDPKRFQGLGITIENISEQTDVSYIKLEFNTTAGTEGSFTHTLKNKFLSISSLNIRNKDTDYNLNEQIDSDTGNLINVNTNSIALAKYVNGNLTKTLAKISASELSNNNSVLINFDAASSMNAGKLGFSNEGELLISGETDSHSALRLSKKGSSTELSAGLTGPAAGDTTTSARIIYKGNSVNTEDYLSLPKEPSLSSYSANHRLLWVKTVSGDRTYSSNSWISFDDLEKSLISRADNKLQSRLTRYDSEVKETVATSFEKVKTKNIDPVLNGLKEKIIDNFNEDPDDLGIVPEALNDIELAIDNANKAAKDANDAAADIENSLANEVSRIEREINEALTNVETEANNVNTESTNKVNDEIERLEIKFNALKDALTLPKIQIVEVAYPVGSIFMSLKDTDPNEQLGINNIEGLTIKWEKLDPDNYLSTGRSSGSYESVSYLNNDESLGLFKYGSDTIKLTANDLPKHRHGMAYGGDNGEYGDWIVLRSKNEVELAKTTETETGDNSMNFSTDPSSGYTDDIARYFNLLSYSGYNYHTDPGHESCRVPRRLYTAPNLRSDSSGRTLNRIIKNKASYIAYNPKSIAVNMWIRVK